MMDAWPFDTTATLAIYGAVVATIVFLWDIFKWWTAGPRIVLTASSGNRIVSPLTPDGELFISVTARNNGDHGTTITNLGYYFYRSRWKWILRKPDRKFAAPDAGVATYQAMPCLLQPGGVWNGLTREGGGLKGFIGSGILVCVLYESSRERPRRCRVTPS